MLTFGTPDPRVLDVVGTVVERLEQDTGVPPSAVMVVGAHARNIIHSGLKRSTSPRATDDVDLALALSGWDAYLPVTTTFPRSGDSDIRYRVGDIHVDFMPFGPALEDPPGVVTPPPRKEGWTVADFQDVYGCAQDVRLMPQGDTVRVPSPAGYTALKLRSWADRAIRHDIKDARDLALACHWYSESDVVHDELYSTPHGKKLLEDHGFDQDLAAVGLLSAQVASILSDPVKTDLATDLRGSDRDLLAREFTNASAPHWSEDRSRRRSIIDTLFSAFA